MPIKADRWIRQMAEFHRMIEPFSSSQVAEDMISYGLSSYGYDLRLGGDFKIFVPPPDVILNPKSVPPEYYRDHQGRYCDIPPNGYILGRTLEYLRIPRDVLAVSMGKSTYARTGVLVNVTPFEPEWEGFVTVSIANTTPVPVRVFANEGICQVLFFQSDEPCEVSYKDRKGKYQAQQKIEFPKLHGGE
ncbi:MAG: dCTP deaminase [Acidobacteria bacterium]|nr:MAG: dCTP deaminase [Acidobacteriota bacterium]